MNRFTQWQKAGLGSSQGYTLSDLLSPKRVADMVEALREASAKAALPRTINEDQLNGIFSVMFFSGRFHVDTNMVASAEIFENIILFTKKTTTIDELILSNVDVKLLAAALILWSGSLAISLAELEALAHKFQLGEGVAPEERQVLEKFLRSHNEASD